MYFSIDLNNQVLFKRYKINNVSIDRMLPSKFYIKVPFSQRLPQSIFRRGRIFSHFLRSFKQNSNHRRIPRKSSIHSPSTGGGRGENFELDGSPLTPTNPIGLGVLQRQRPIDFVQPVQQTLGISGDAHAPLRHFLSDDRMSPTLGNPVHNFIIGQYGSQSRTPVYLTFGKVGQPIF